MESLKLAQSNQKLRAVRLGITVGLAMLFLVVLLCGLQGVTPAHADPGILYVYGATGQDTGTCGTTSTPCKTISYTLNSRASGGDTIRVAQGVYTENLTINISVTLEGGYESTGWTRDITQYETIIDGSNSQTVVGDWDGGQVMKQAVISDGAEYKMWFDGANLLNESQVGLATSADGISWTKYFTNPVLTGTTGAWDESGEHAPFVLKESGIYKMWYEGSDGSVRQLGYATSTNGIDWNKYAGNPVLSAGPEGYDQEAAAHGSVLNDGGTYKLWYHAIGDEGIIIAYATSPNGLNWTKQGPVLKPTSAGNWEDYALWGPSVLKLNGMYWMWYAAWGSQELSAIGVVTSTNGITWTRFLATPVVTETTIIGDPHVISDSGKLKMWYSDYGQGVINYAESNDGISWTKSSSNPVLTPGTPGQWAEPVVRFEAGSGDAVLDGFTVTGGDTDSGGGLRIEDDLGANITVRNTAITSNTAGNNGGGVWIGQNSGLVLETSTVSNNTANGWGGGGIIVKAGATLVVSKTLITGNVVQDTGGGITAHSGGNVVRVYNSVIRDNHAIIGNAGGIWAGEGAYLELVNDIIAGNKSWDCCAGVQVYRSSAWVMNTTVVSNSTATGGGGNGFFIDFNDEPGWFVTVTNSILWGNVPGDFGTYREGTSTSTVSHSDIGNGFVPGLGNISTDPRFVDVANGDYHLSANSPAIDTGTNVGAPATDFEGDPRPLDGDLNGVAITDMGADEFRPYQIYLPITLKNFGP